MHQFSSHHRDLLARSEQAGCFYCCAVFLASEIQDWTDWPLADARKTADGVTALCPRCGIDAVLPGAAPITLSPELLAQMHRRWFGR